MVTMQAGHVYVCGDVSMAHDVSSALEIIIKTEGGLSELAAKTYLVKMRVRCC